MWLTQGFFIRLQVIRCLLSLFFSVILFNQVYSTTDIMEKIIEDQERNDIIDTNSICNSLNGPFCLPLDATTYYSNYMKNIITFDTINNVDTSTSLDKKKILQEQTQSSRKYKRNTRKKQKKCSFERYPEAWMDNGGDQFDLQSQRVDTRQECEDLCCNHIKCKSYSYLNNKWCYLRAKNNPPRDDKTSYSGNKY